MKSPLFSNSPPHFSHFAFFSSCLSTFVLFLHFLQTTATSTNDSMCPDALHTFGCVMIEPSIPVISSRMCT